MIINFDISNSETNALEPLRKAVDCLRANPGSTLVIPPGRYTLSDPEACRIQNDVLTGKYGQMPSEFMYKPEFPFVVALDFTGCENVTVEAAGVTLMIDGFMEVLSICNCRGVTVRGITIDYIRRPFTRGIVISDNSDYLDVQTNFCDEKNAGLPIPRMVLIRRGRHDHIWWCPKHEWRGDGVFRFHESSRDWKGESIYFIHTFHYRPGIMIYQATNTLIEDVTIFSQPGMGVVGHRSQDTVMRHLRIVPAPGESISCNTDATHFASCRGKLRYEDCWFEGQTDDSANIHTYYHKIVEVDGRKLKTTCGHTIHSLHPDYPDPGDTVELSVPDTLALLGAYKVTGRVWNSADKTTTVELDREPPANCIGNILSCVSQLPELEFVNCVCRNHEARGILIKTRNALVENCLFDGTVSTAIHVAAEANWDEAATCENIIIRRNRVVRCGTSSRRDAGGVVVELVISGKGEVKHKNIVIEDNIFDCGLTPHAVYVADTDGLTITGNQVSSLNEAIVVDRSCLNFQNTTNGSKL